MLYSIYYFFAQIVYVEQTRLERRMLCYLCCAIILSIFTSITKTEKMTTLLEEKINAFLDFTACKTPEIQNELIRFFSGDNLNRYVVVNGNVSLFENENLKNIIDLPKERPQTWDTFLFDGADITIVNSSDSSDSENKKRTTSSNNNNNNNNNNNG